MGRRIDTFRLPGGRVISRFVPVADPRAYKTYSVAAPLGTHWRAATCEEAGCEAYRLGWVTVVDLTTELGQKRYHYLTHDQSRRPSMQRDGNTVRFVYGPGFRCFRSSEHRVPLERPPRLLVADGDWRGNPTGRVQVHTRFEDWHDDFSNHQDRIATALARG